MNYRFTPEQEAFRQEFVSWLENNYPEGFNPSKFCNYTTPEESLAAYKSFQKRLHDGGYAGMHYPKEYGRQGKAMIEEAIVLQSPIMVPQRKS